MIATIFLTALSFFNPAISADSLRLETINGKTFVIHQVGERETLYGISRRYGATIPGILEFNPTADGGLAVGTILKVPYVPKSKVQTSAGLVHTVAPKETLFSISKLYNVTIDDLKTWNNLKDYSLSTGQQLVIKKQNTALTAENVKPTEVKPVTSSGNSTHIVVQGETLYSLARQYNVSVQQIKDWNTLTTNELKIGQAVVISAATSAPVAASVPVVTTPKPQTTTPVVVAPTLPKPIENTIQISESVAGTDEIKESGLAELIEGTEGNRKYMAMHRSAPVGTILKVRNELNNREVFVRVVGSLPSTSINDKIVIKISKSAYDRLGAIDPKFRAEVTYYK